MIDAVLRRARHCSRTFMGAGFIWATTESARSFLVANTRRVDAHLRAGDLHAKRWKCRIRKPEVDLRLHVLAPWSPHWRRQPPAYR